MIAIKWGRPYRKVCPCYLITYTLWITLSLILNTALLKLYEAGEEDVVLKVDMLEESIHKGLQILQHKPICRAGIFGSLEIVHKGGYIFVACTLVVMLTQHHTNRIGHSATVHLLVLQTTLGLLEEVVAVWEENLLLLLKVVLEIFERVSEVVTQFKKLGVTVTMRVCHTLDVAEQLWSTLTDIAMMNL
jgi:hypothetical protein